MTLTNVGKAEILSLAMRRWTRPGSVSIGDHGFLLDGAGDPAVALILITSAFNFTAQAGRPNPDLGTVGAIDASVVGGCIINPSGFYTGNTHKVHPDYIDVTQDDAGDLGEITFNASHLPLLSAVQDLNNVRGYVLAKQNNITTARVIDLVQLDNTYNISAGQQFNLTNYGLAIL